MVSWGSSGGNARGKVVKIKRNGSINVPNSSFTITGTEDNPAVLIRIYKDGKPTDTLVGHKMKSLNSVKKDIGNNSSQAHDPIEEPGHVEYYVRGGEKNMSEEIVEKASTEPDPKGDIAVLKSANSDLARSDIEKAIEALTAIAKSLPDVSRATEVSVNNEITQETYDQNPSIVKDVGNADDVVGDGANSKPANEPVDRPQGVMKKSTCGEADCSGEDCSKCMAKDMEMVTKSEDGKDSEPDSDADDTKVYKSAQDLINDAKMHKSVWGGAFGPTKQATIGVFQK
jgi:hypothetical protein